MLKHIGKNIIYVKGEIHKKTPIVGQTEDLKLRGFTRTSKLFIAAAADISF